MEKYLNDMLSRYPELTGTVPALRELLDDLVKLFKNSGTFFVAGNGGSGADAEHICGELLKGFKSKRELNESDRNALKLAGGSEGEELGKNLQYGLPAISLLSHPALTSAFGNDVDPLLSFAQQLWALGKKGDIVMGISTSGNAANIKKLFITARAKGIKTVLLTGNRHGYCENWADLVIAVPEKETFKIQELHLPLYHTMCMAVESQFFKMME